MSLSKEQPKKMLHVSLASLPVDSEDEISGIDIMAENEFSVDDDMSQSSKSQSVREGRLTRFCDWFRDLFTRLRRRYRRRNREPFDPEMFMRSMPTMPHLSTMDVKVNYAENKMNVSFPIEMCLYCLEKGYAPSFAKTHSMRSSCGVYVVCPVLWSSVCESCGQTGPLAHPLTLCPLVQAKNKFT